VIQTELERSVSREDKPCLCEERLDLGSLESVMLADLHSVEDPKSHHHREHPVDTRRGNREDRLASGAKQTSNHRRKRRALIGTDVLEDGERAHGVERLRFVRGVVGKPPGSQREIAAAERTRQVGIQTDPLAQRWADHPKELAVMTPDVEHTTSGTNEPRCLRDAPVADESIDAVHITS
jgi:hypothetical protein